jgi:hypothetical protein
MEETTHSALISLFSDVLISLTLSCSSVRCSARHKSLILAATNKVNSTSRHEEERLTDLSSPGSPSWSPRLFEKPRSYCTIRFLGRQIFWTNTKGVIAKGTRRSLLIHEVHLLQRQFCVFLVIRQVPCCEADSVGSQILAFCGLFRETLLSMFEPLLQFGKFDIGDVEVYAPNGRHDKWVIFLRKVRELFRPQTR